MNHLIALSLLNRFITSALLEQLDARGGQPDTPDDQPGAHACKRQGAAVIRSRRGFGLNEVIGIAAGIIIAVVIVIPGLQVFARNVLLQLTSWWNGMAADIFKS